MVLFIDKGQKLSSENMWAAIMDRREVGILEMGKMIGPAEFRNALQMLLLDKEFLEEFGVRVVKPALDKMLLEFDEARIALKDKVRKKKQKVILMEDMQNKNIYQYALQTIYDVVNVDFQEVNYNDPVIVPTLGVDVLSCGTGCSTTESTDQQPVKMN